MKSKEALKYFLNDLDKIMDQWEEVGDTDVREQMAETIIRYYIYDHANDRMPKSYGMFSLNGDRSVAMAVNRFIERLKSADDASSYDSPAERHKLIQSPGVLSDGGNPYDEYLGHSDDVPDDVEINEQRYDEDTYDNSADISNKKPWWKFW